MAASCTHAYLSHVSLGTEPLWYFNSVFLIMFTEENLEKIKICKEENKVSIILSPRGKHLKSVFSSKYMLHNVTSSRSKKV